MNILLVDDEPLARNELKYLLNQCKGVSSIMEASSIQEAFEILLVESVDLAFLDIQLTNETGLDLAEKIAKIPHPPEIVFATAYDEYAIQAFEKNARDYILKPFELERVQEAIKRVQRIVAHSASKESASSTNQQERKKSFPIQENDRILMVKAEDILAVEVSQGETTIHTNNQPYYTQEPLTSWEEKLDREAFMRVHRSYIIRLDAIEEIQPWFNHTFQVKMTDSLKIPVSRSYMKEFKERVGL